MKVKFSTNYIFAKHSGEKTKYMPSSAKIDKTATNLPLLLCKQAAKIFQTICKKETALKRVLRNLLSAISFAQI